MTNDYKAENVVRFIDDFVEKEEHFDSIFFNQLSCMFTTLALMCGIDADTRVCDTLIKRWWQDIEANCDTDFTSEDYDAFYNLMVKWII